MLRKLIHIPLLLALVLAVASCSGGGLGLDSRATSAVTQPTIDATALPNASFTLRKANGNKLAGPFDTDTPRNVASLDDEKYYIEFDNDSSNHYQVICPARPGDGFVRFKKGKFEFDGGGNDGMDDWFEIQDNGKLLKLKANRYSLVTNNFTATPGLTFRLLANDCGCGGEASTDAPAYAALGRGTRYVPVFDSDSDKLVFPPTPALGWFKLESNGSLSLKGDFADAFSVSGTTATLLPAVYVRFRNDTNWGGTPPKWRLTGPLGFLQSPKYDYDTQSPWPSFVLAQGLSFRVEAGSQRSQVLTVGPGNSISGFAAKGYSFASGERSGVLNVEGGTRPNKAVLADSQVLATIDGVDVVNGGYGSGMAPVAGEPYSMYLLTDRGPNIDGPNANEKIFPAPAFNPQIGKFYLYDDQLVKDSVILLRDAAGNPRTGLPRLPGTDGNTGEIGKDYSGNTLYDAQGIDSEGLVAAADGTFWVSDEYGPFILHLDATGKTIGELNPFNGALPKVLATRRVNKGMEGLTQTPNGTLVGTMQQPLVNPVDNSTVKNSRVGRIVTYKAGVRHEYVYVFDTKDMSACDIVALSDTTFIVDERDGNFFGAAGTIKKVYRIDIGGATDVTDPADGPNGKLWAGKTLEQVTFSGLAANSIVPVTKTLVLDLSTLAPTYPHDKFEGLEVIDANTIALADDDDFHVVGTTTLVPKFLFDGTTIDFGEVYFAHTLTPLY